VATELHRHNFVNIYENVDIPNLDTLNPSPDTLSTFRFRDHNSWGPRPRLETHSAIVLLGRFNNGCDFLARGHVVRFDEGAVEHWWVISTLSVGTGEGH